MCTLLSILVKVVEVACDRGMLSEVYEAIPKGAERSEYNSSVVN